MIAYACDACGVVIDLESRKWYGLDNLDPLGDETTGSEYDYGHHFCTVECVASWAFMLAAEHTR